MRISYQELFDALNRAALDADEVAKTISNRIIENLQSAPKPGEQARYPGERTLQTRKANLQHGIPVDLTVWNKVLAMAV